MMADVDENLFEFDDEDLANPTDIRVIGVGGGGNNAVTRMKDEGIPGVKMISANTDTQDLRNARADVKISLGERETDGLGAGADPKTGVKSAQESEDKIREALEGADMLFITAGMGGGTGTGASPVIAEMAQDLGILTIGVVTRPFSFEAQKRAKKAEKGVKALRENVDTLIVVPNDRLFDVADDDLPMTEAYELADQVLHQGVHGISEVIVEDGLVNLDFADVRTVMEQQGDAMMGIGEGAGGDGAVEAAKDALDCPLLETNDIEGATGLLVNVAGGSQLTAQDVREAIQEVSTQARQGAEVIFGHSLREDFDDMVRVTVIATGFPADKRERRQRQGRGRDNVINVGNPDEADIDRPAYERRERGSREQPEADLNDEPEPAPEEGNYPEDDDDDDDLSIPTFMRVN